MSQENVDLTREAFERFNREDSDPDAILKDLFDPTAVWHVRACAGAPDARSAAGSALSATGWPTARLIAKLTSFGPPTRGEDGPGPQLSGSSPPHHSSVIRPNGVVRSGVVQVLDPIP